MSADKSMLLAQMGQIKSRSDLLDVLHQLHCTAKAEAAEGDSLIGQSFFALAERLISSMTSQLIGYLTKKELKDLLLAPFVDGPLLDSFLVLSQSLKNSPGDLGRILWLLDSFMQMRLSAIFVKLVANLDANLDLILQPFAQALAALPSVVANSVGPKWNACFDENRFWRQINVSLVRSLKAMRERMGHHLDVSTAFLRLLLAKLIRTGYGDKVVDILVSFLLQKVPDDFLWPRISQKIFADLPDFAVELLVFRALSSARSCENLNALWGSLIQVRPEFNRLLTHTLFFVRPLRSARQVRLLLQYIAAQSPPENCLIVNLIVELLHKWANCNSLLLTDFEDHFWLTKMLLIAVLLLNELQKTALLQTQAVEILMNGVQQHLDSALENIRTCGMLLGERLVTTLQPAAGSDLKFDIDRENDVYRELVGDLSEAVETGTFPGNLDILVSCLDETDDVCDTPADDVANVVANDSDDDLEPYEIPDELTNPGEFSHLDCCEKPRYIREAMEGLLERKDAKKFRMALEGLEYFIENQAVGFRDIAVELVKILLHCENEFAIENFDLVRFKCMTACCAKLPRILAPFLIEQLYARNYAVNQRMLCLSVLGAAAARLACESHAETPSAAASAAPSSEEMPAWRALVDLRITAKTRRFASASAKAPDARANEFASVAGHFFFPLASGIDTSIQTLDLEGRDHVILAQIMQTLANFVYWGRFSSVAFGMCGVLLELVLLLRFHEQPHVRQAVLFALLMLSVVAGSITMLKALIGPIREEMCSWLADTMSNDADQECRSMAAEILVFLTPNNALSANSERGTSQGKIVELS